MANAKTYALYMELHKDTRGSQVLVIPPLYDSISGTTQRAQIMTRKISEMHPRRSWSKVTVRRDFNADPSMHEAYPTSAGVTELVTRVADEVGVFFTGLAAGRWTVVKEPVMVEMSFDDIRDIQSDKTPNALIRRIMKARAEAGYPSTIWPSKTPQPLIESVFMEVPAEPTVEYIRMDGTIHHLPAGETEAVSVSIPAHTIRESL